MLQDDITISTPYGVASVARVLSWPNHLCPTCGREHGHPPAVTAAYWPE